MKLLLTSVDAVIDYETGKPFDGIIEVFDLFRSLATGNEVIVLSSHKDKLAMLPEEVPSALIENRGSNSPIEKYLIERTEFNDRSKIVVLAANEADFRTAVNTKLLFIGAGYAKNYLNEDSKAYKYGLQVQTVDELAEFFDRFLNVENPWYYRLDVSDDFAVYSLTSSNTMGNKSHDAVTLSNKFRQCLKQGNERTRGAFISYFIVGIYNIVKEVENIDYWGVYPSSRVEQNSDLEYFKELARTTFKVRKNDPLFIRHTKSVKRNEYRGNRVDFGCENQFETMIINPAYKGKLAGKTVGVIDDFTTFGTSAETVRALLEKEGVAKVVFITLGKFGRDYYKYSYQIEGDVYSPGYTFTRTAEPRLLRGSTNSASDTVFVNCLKGLV